MQLMRVETFQKIKMKIDLFSCKMKFRTANYFVNSCKVIIQRRLNCYKVKKLLYNNKPLNSAKICKINYLSWHQYKTKIKFFQMKMKV